jgi:hypothetical protein
MIDRDDPRYRRAARLLAQKLGVDWRDLPYEQVLEYLRKIEIVRPERKDKIPPESTGDSDVPTGE